eukprot:TRINITY_DN3199_c0_g1_i2.p1 TRINITY_DN3199_c0_g1~~TRINITY_DN3199_c0_g1_i2.p1  ORF type:complete len:140 (-),score=2.08 TRINITY_DN3199_c0_g1_i2:609-1028(-)
MSCAPFEYSGAIVFETPGQQGCRKLTGAGIKSAFPAKPTATQNSLRGVWRERVELDPGVRVGCRAWVFTGGRTHAATVRSIGWIGSTQETERLWVGVELQDPVGRHSGQAVDGQWYFRCRHGHGLYVRPECVEPWFNNL